MSELRVNNITNRDGKRGTVVAGIPQVTSTSHFVPPSGKTIGRYIEENTIVTDGLIFYVDASIQDSWDQGNAIGFGTSHWRDLSGYGNDVKFVNAPSYSGGFGGHLLPDGVDDYGTTPNIVLKDCTIQIWAKVTKGTNNVIFNDSSNLYRNFLRLDGYVDGGRVIWGFEQDYQFTWYGNSGIYENMLFLNDLRLFTLRRKENIVTLFFGDTKVGDITVSDAGLNLSNDITFTINTLFRRSDNTQYAQGEYYNISIYNRALTAAEVLQNYNATKSRYGY